jgi:cell division protein FtsB
MKAVRRRRIAALAGLLVVLGAMAWTPYQRYREASERVLVLTATREQLAVEVDALEDQRARLEDPDEVELLAREELGLVKPGEIPYVVVPPEERETASVPQPQPVVPWWRRLADRLGLS